MSLTNVPETNQGHAQSTLAHHAGPLDALAEGLDPRVADVPGRSPARDAPMPVASPGSEPRWRTR